MSLDDDVTKLTKLGTVTVTAGESIVVSGFEGDNCTCRDVAVQACLWAIAELAREALKDVESPGGGNTAIGN